MNGLNKRYLIVFAIFTCLTIPSLTVAETIPITGTAEVLGAVDAGFSFTGPSLQLFSKTRDWPTFSSGCQIPATYNFEGLLSVHESGGTVNGASADILAGHLTVSPCFSGGIAPSQPAMFTGDIYGYKVLNTNFGGYALGPMVFALEIHGTGTFVQPGPAPHSTNAQYTITSGTATLTPEPASLLLFATGLIGLALVVRRRVRRKA